VSSFTVNKNIQQPAAGSFNNIWDEPVNADWEIIDQAFGGNTIINVTGASGVVALTVTQYTPPNIVFDGTLSANVTYVLPTGVGGMWSIFNQTTGAFVLSFAVAGGGGSGVQQGQRTLFVCDGDSMFLADTAPAAQALASAEAFATAADTVVLAAAETFSANASNLSAGTVANARLPLAAAGPGVTIMADPGTVPTGPAGSIWYFY
jgi:hypothetical protein